MLAFEFGRVPADLGRVVGRTDKVANGRVLFVGSSAHLGAWGFWKRQTSLIALESLMRKAQHNE